MRIGAMLAGLGLLASACGGEASGAKQASSAGLGDATANAGSSSSNDRCGYSPSLDDAGPGACGVGRAFVSCTGANGGCLCLSDDPTTCANCAEQFPGPLSCESKCAANEYAVSCGGPPGPPDAPRTYQDVPATCRAVGATPGGSQYACCPCQ